MGTVLFLQGGGLPPREGVGALVVGQDWPDHELRLPHLTDEWLAQPFTEQLVEVKTWLEDAVACVGTGWGAWLLICALVEREKEGLSLPIALCCSSFFRKGCFTGQQGVAYQLPRSQEIQEAMGLGKGRAVLAEAEIRFVHGRRDTLAPVEELRGLEARFSVQIVESGHLLKGAGERAVAQELKRLRARLGHRRRSSRS